ncbi:hypothetical protein DC434_13730 [Microbacterium sp. TPD7012]|nr:hypothetical protein DC434_13730 [Microbacterium sp. TPD7012]
MNAVPAQEAVAAYVAAETDTRRAVGDAALAAVIGFSANAYGADPAATWQVNRDAFQAANDAAVAAGGGRVTARRGEYLAKGIVQDSNVEFFLPGVTIKSPDGLPPNVLSSRQVDVTGSVATGGTAVTVASTAGIAEGARVAVQGAGGILDTQFTRLSADITSSQTSGIQLVSVTGLNTAGVLQVGTELISFTGRSGAMLSGVTRGAFGSTAVAHTTAENIGVARRFYATVTAIAGTTLTIDRPAVLGVTDAQVSVGAVNVKITGGKIDGNAEPTGAAASTYAIYWPLTRLSEIVGTRVENGDQGGIILTRGAADNLIRGVTLHNCGIPAVSKGSAFWLYQGCVRNNVMGLSVTGRAWVAVYLDDRTTTAEDWDAPNIANVFTNTTVDVVGSGTAVLNIVGSSHNRFLGGSIKSPNVGINMSQNSQGVTADGSKPPTFGNDVGGFYLDVLQGWTLFAPGNNLHDTTVAATASALGTNTGENMVYATSVAVGGAPATRSAAPVSGAGTAGYAFQGDPNTGVYSDGADQLGLAVGGAGVLRLFPTEARLADGVNLTAGGAAGTKIGANAGQKLGFFGATPVTQPAAPPANASDLASTITLVNDLRTKLRTLGLLA